MVEVWGVSFMKKNSHFEFCCPVCRKSYRSLALLWAGSSIAHQIVLIPGVLVGKGILRLDA